jgi:lysozyme family protein
MGIDRAFDKAFDRLMGHEGGYTDNPKDPGGETNWGISKRSYPNVDIKNLTRDQAAALYLRDFWQPLGDAHPAVKFQTFDFAVNSGMQTAIRKLQAAIGVADDGHWGPMSAKALASMDVNDVLMKFMAQRLRFWVKCSAWPTMGAGWINRGASQLDYAAEDN